MTMATGGPSDTCYNQGMGCQDDREIRNIYNLEVNNRYGNAFNVYRRELAPGTVSLTGDRAQGDDSQHCAYCTGQYGGAG